MPRRNDDNDNRGRWGAIVIIALVLIILALLYPNISQYAPLILNPTVNVSGFVTTSGFTSSPDHITFVSAGRPSTAATGRNGAYDIQLSNAKIYNITVQWTAAGGLASGNCSGGSLNLHASGQRITYNVSC